MSADQLRHLLYRAEQHLLSREIYTGGALTEFLESERSALNLEFDVAYHQALSMGLYHFLGEQYQSALTFTIEQVREDINDGLIKSKADLRFYFERAARKSVPEMPTEKAIADLMIDARQGGVLNLLETLTGTVRPSVSVATKRVA